GRYIAGVTDAVISAVRNHLTAHLAEPGAPGPESASMTFLGLEPVEVLRFRGELVRYATLGCSRHPMGDPADMIADPSRGPRAELILSMRDPHGVTSGVHRTLAVLAA